MASFSIVHDSSSLEFSLISPFLSSFNDFASDIRSFVQSFLDSQHLVDSDFEFLFSRFSSLYEDLQAFRNIHSSLQNHFSTVLKKTDRERFKREKLIIELDDAESDEEMESNDLNDDEEPRDGGTPLSDPHTTLPAVLASPKKNMASVTQTGLHFSYFSFPFL